MNGIKISQTETHLKKFKVSGGTSKRYANLPTIKLPDQHNVANTSSEYAK